MAISETQPSQWTLSPFLLDGDDFTRMARDGYFDEHRVELLGGRLFVMTLFPPHILGVIKAARSLNHHSPGDSWSIREEKPLKLEKHWLLLPDLAVVRGPAEDYGSRLPIADDTVLLVEVADTNYLKDREPKWRR